MNCDVSLGDYDGDSPKVFNSTHVRSRKPHQCFECKETIPAGAMCERVSGLWPDSGWETYRFCEACSEIGLEFSENGRSFGMLWEGMQDNWSDGAHILACIQRVSTVAAKSKLQAMWLDWKEL
jgi:hypothetical protein